MPTLHRVQLEGFEGQTIEVQSGNLLAGPKLLVNGQPAPAGKPRGTFTLRRNDGAEVGAWWKPQFMGLDAPQLVVDSKTIAVVEPLKWYQWLWGGLPLALVFIGGALGALAGVLAMSLNLQIFRSSLNGLLKFIAAGAVSVAAVVVYFVLSVLLYNLING